MPTAQLIAELLRKKRCEVIGPISHMIDSLESINSGRVDACILDWTCTDECRTRWRDCSV